MEEVIDIKKNEVINSEEDNQLKAIKEQMKQLIDKADSVVIFAFSSEKNMNGQELPKTLIKDKYGVMSVGNPNFHYVHHKVKLIIDDIHQAELVQRASISE